MFITINKNKYLFLRGYQRDDMHRLAFNMLSEKVFGLSFESWYQSGCWNDKYIPYTLFDCEKAVANVSVNIMDFCVLGRQQRYIQIGTVMTDPDYRGKNLNRFLMEKVLGDWAGKCDLVYLYANMSVLNLYPKFGFFTAKEHEYYLPIINNSANTKVDNIKKLNMDMQSNRDMLYGYVKNTKVFAQIAGRENADLAMFYCTSFLKDNIYYIKSLDVIVVGTLEGTQLHMYDIFGKDKVDLDKVITELGCYFKIEGVLLGFTPIDARSYEAHEISGDDTLFVMTKDKTVFSDNKIMFPLLSHA